MGAVSDYSSLRLKVENSSTFIPWSIYSIYRRTTCRRGHIVPGERERRRGIHGGDPRHQDGHQDTVQADAGTQECRRRVDAKQRIPAPPKGHELQRKGLYVQKSCTRGRSRTHRISRVVNLGKRVNSHHSCDKTPTRVSRLCCHYYYVRTRYGYNTFPFLLQRKRLQSPARLPLKPIMIERRSKMCWDGFQRVFWVQH